jgi:flagellar biosynthesis protein FlhB
VVVAAAAVVLTQAAKMRQYIWMTLFLVVVCLFNPVFPVPFSSYIFGIVSIFAVILFFFSLELLRPKRRLSIASITDRMPGSESL